MTTRSTNSAFIALTDSEGEPFILNLDTIIAVRPTMRLVDTVGGVSYSLSPISVGKLMSLLKYNITEVPE